MARREEEGGESKRNKGEEGVGRGRERERKGNGERGRAVTIERMIRLLILEVLLSLALIPQY